MRWHRRLGLGAGLLVVFAAASGVLLNHADALGLPQRPLCTPWLMRWYGLEPPTLRAAWRIGPRWFSQWGRRLVLDGQALDTPEVDGVLGVFAFGPAVAVVDLQRVLLLRPEGQLVDTLPLPAGLVAARAAVEGDTLVLESTDGRRVRSDDALSAWSPAPVTGDLPWAAPDPLPDGLAGDAAGCQRGDGVSAERLLLDLHSGRWLGRPGVWLMDAAAVVLLALAATGAATVWRRWRRPRQERPARVSSRT